MYLTTEAKRLDKEYKKKTNGVIIAENDDEITSERKGLPKVSMLSEVNIDWKGWLKEGSFYIHGIVYMLVRIAVNVTMVSTYP